jgi:transposase-like protein
MIARMAGPERVSATKLAEEVGVSQNTLSRWLREAREEEKRGNGVQRTAHAKRGSRSMGPEDLPAAEKLRLVMEAAKLSEKDLGAFLRRHGLHEAQLEEWRRKVEEASLGALEKPRRGRKRQSPEAKRVRKLERELDRKDKALAEVTALLALKKKLDALLGDEDDDTAGKSGR